MNVTRKQGYAVTTVDRLRQEAGVTKGAFFHHFRCKEDLGVAAADHWYASTGRLFASAAYLALDNPLDRILAYIEFRKALISGAVPQFTCLVGTMVQETYESNPAIRDACHRSIVGHARTLENNRSAAAEQQGATLPSSAEPLALHTQAVLQGAYVLAKAGNDPSTVRNSLDHLSTYIQLLFRRPSQELSP